jgi:hypothetical protein
VYIATVGTTIVEQADTLAELRRDLSEIFERDMGEDVVVWEDGRRVVLVMTSDGRTVEMDGPSLTWNWPTRKATA